MTIGQTYKWCRKGIQVKRRNEIKVRNNGMRELFYQEGYGEENDVKTQKNGK
jgi:uncharacterized protein (UPF0371 family)